jgi:endonuclease-8
VPEGDTVFRTAAQLHRALADDVVTRWDLRVPSFATSDLRGEQIHEVVSRGKHILHRVGDVTLHTHLKMEGAWHLYRPESRWRRPEHTVRAVVGTESWVAVGFDLGVTEVIARDREDDVVGHLGPDLLGPDWDAVEAIHRLSADPARPLAVALLDQRNLAGIGNVFANEICFLRGALPTRPVGDVDVPRAVDLAHRLLRANRDRAERTTTGDTRAGRQLWVYGRDGKPCRRCGTRIRGGELGANELALRVTSWCPHCQT